MRQLGAFRGRTSAGVFHRAAACVSVTSPSRHGHCMAPGPRQQSLDGRVAISASGCAWACVVVGTHSQHARRARASFDEFRRARFVRVVSVPGVRQLRIDGRMHSDLSNIHDSVRRAQGSCIHGPMREQPPVRIRESAIRCAYMHACSYIEIRESWKSGRAHRALPAPRSGAARLSRGKKQFRSLSVYTVGNTHAQTNVAHLARPNTPFSQKRAC